MARGCYDTALEDDFAAFSVAIIRVGVSLVRRQSQQDAQNVPAAQSGSAAAAGIAASDERARQLRYTQGDNSCLGHKIGSEEFFAPGTRTASGGLKPRWTQEVQEDDSDCEDY